MSTGKSNQTDSCRSIAQSAGVISIATLCSRLLGFVRDMTIARLFGVYLYAQAFVVAFKIPNLFRDLLGEGAANAAFVPVFSEYSAKHTQEEFWELANIVLNLLLVILATVTIVGILFAPLVVRLIAPGFCASPEKLAATIRLTQIIFPYVLLISLTAYAGSLLNTLRHFTVPAFAPCLLNISIIVCALLWGEGIRGLATGVLAGGLLQLAVQLPVLYKKGFRLKRVNQFRHPAIKTLGRLMLPRLLSSGIYQLNNFVDTIFGSLIWIVGEGGVAVLYFSYRLVQFPLGLFSNALSQALLPALSTHALEDSHEHLKRTLTWGLRSTFFVMIPASVAFMALNVPIVLTIFGGGRFDPKAAQVTAQALFYYSIGLSAYGGTKILQSCFFALKDTLTSAKIAVLALIINVVLNSLLMFPLKIGGIALATSISGIISFLVLFYKLKQRLGDFKVKEIFFSFLRILAASVCMGLACYYAVTQSKDFATSSLLQVVRLVLLILLGVCSYILFCMLFRVSEMWDLGKWIARKK
ncbi:MAG: murein biosynthesis integral membrane protein MurJ [Candidatus Omnitrophota bacterium]|jgi:putative peptidoglycan lipid II flippase